METSTVIKEEKHVMPLIDKIEIPNYLLKRFTKKTGVFLVIISGDSFKEIRKKARAVKEQVEWLKKNHSMWLTKQQ